METSQSLDDKINGGENLTVPYSTSVLVLGILSIALCWCYGVVGTTLGIIALVQAGRGSKAYQTSPGSYKEGSYKNLKAGKVCAIVGLSLSALYLIYVICLLVFIGTALTTLPWQQMLKK
jgi:hypothetical protein